MIETEIESRAVIPPPPPTGGHLLVLVRGTVLYSTPYRDLKMENILLDRKKKQVKIVGEAIQNFTVHTKFGIVPNKCVSFFRFWFE